MATVAAMPIPAQGETWFDGTGEWALTITGPEVGSVSPARLTDVGLFVQMAGCELNVAGEVSGKLDDASGISTPTGSNLTIADEPSGFICPVFGFTGGDAVVMSGTFSGAGLSITNP